MVSAGRCCCCGGGWDLIKTLRFKRRAVEDEGIIIARDEYTAEGGRIYHMPIVRFHYQGQSYTFKSRYSRSGGERIYPVSRKLAVWFLPENPAGSARVKSVAYLYLRPVVLLMIGLGNSFVVLGPLLHFLYGQGYF